MRRTRDKSDVVAGAGVSRSQQRADEPLLADEMRELQQSAGNQALLRLLGTGAVQTKRKGSGSGLLLQRKCAACAVGAPCSECEEEEERPHFKRAGLMVQRAARAGGQSNPTGTQAETTPGPAKTAPSLIVEDDAKDVSSGQMRKSEFLSQLRTAICSTAEQALAGTMWSAMGCPYIERWLDHYGKRPSSYLERALRKYAPETASARSAAEYIPLVTQRLRRGIEEWRSTGEIPEIPPELAGETPGMTASGLLGGLISGVGSAISGLVGGAGRALSNVGKMLFKHREGSDNETADPATIRSQLGSGSALDGKVAGRMKTVYGADFSSVRVHTDAKAQTLNESLNARAFTIGNDIAFAAGEYRPGTLIGDALIAHELAHVVQQSGGNTSSGPMQMGGAEPSSLEEDADVAAVGAMASLWGGRLGNVKAMGRRALPSLRAGLKLQRCPASQTPATKPPTTVPKTPTGPTTTPTGPSTTPPATGKGVITEELGSAHCDLNQGKKVFVLKPEKIPICMIDCATEHELAHVRFDQECAKVAAFSKKVDDATTEAEAAVAAKDLTRAEAAVENLEKAQKEFDQAVTDYEEWHKRTLCENEALAYQAGIDKCKEKKVVDQCAGLKEMDRYKQLMNDWERFKKNPPGCK